MQVSEAIEISLCAKKLFIGSWGPPVDMPHKEQRCSPANCAQQQEPAVADHEHIQEEEAALKESRPAVKVVSSPMRMAYVLLAGDIHSKCMSASLGMQEVPHRQLLQETQ